MVTPGRPATIAVLGAGGRLGRHVVAEALTRGHTVHAAVHRTNPLPVHPRLQIRSADVHRLDMIQAALSSAGSVISCLGSAAANPPDIQTAGARNLVIAMKALGLPRLVSVTGSGARMPGERPATRYTIQQDAPDPATTLTYQDAARAMLDLATDDKPAWTRTAPFVTTAEPPQPEAAPLSPRWAAHPRDR
jgi:putative NADH-flavin reductase